MSSDPVKNRSTLQAFLQPFAILPFNEWATRYYGRIRSSLEAAGTPIGSLDTLIAAHALSLDFVLVTNNLREFSRVQGLKVENWVPA